MRYINRVGSGTIAALITLAVVGVGLVAGGGRMFSPGALSTENRHGTELGGVASHSELAGNCSACHAGPLSRQSMATRCLECHTNIKEQMDAHRSMHGAPLSDGMKCRTCHTEHNGAHAALTSLDRFDHDQAAFKLTGKHQSTDCKACHANNVFGGTPTACVSCHAEPKVHMGRFGTRCSECHSTSTWSDATPKGFDHDLAAFKLTGKHKAVACVNCHVDAVYKGTPQTCVSCHGEPKAHKGKFGTRCAECHSTSTWSGATFKHTFPINHGGRRKANTCSTCHKDATNYKQYTCYGCHAHNPEKIARKHRRFANFDNCVKCHRRGREHDRRDREGEGERRRRRRASNLEEVLGCQRCCAGLDSLGER